MSEKQTVMLGINVSTKERDEVHKLARQRGYKITSDYLRDLIIADAKAHNIEIEFDLNRGGYRGRKD